MPNNSPWLAQLKKRRQVKKLENSHSSEIAVVGGGIAGVSTAYYLLRDTKHKVSLIEATNIAHGATGHNAGQALAAFERPLEDMVAEFGLEQATAGQKALDDTWILLEEIIRDAKLKLPYYRFIGYNGYVEPAVIMRRLAKNFYLKQVGLPIDELLIADNFSGLKDIPKAYAGLYRIATADEVMSLLETKDERFVACVPETRAIFNSALFCEELVEYLEATYPDRFTVLEHTPIKKVSLGIGSALLEVKDHGHLIKVDKVILCTNGFENIQLEIDSGIDIDTRFHHDINGLVSYMTGYLDKENAPPMAICYLDYLAEAENPPYFYLTRRPYSEEAGTENLIVAGGPEFKLADRAVYHPHEEYVADAAAQFDKFFHQTYAPAPKGEIDYKFQWHGLMGYTKNRVRLIGVEPCHERLLYNLGCNGIGLIPSIYGGWRIAQIIAGKKLAPSIFDPKDLRCAVPKIHVKMDQ